MTVILHTEKKKTSKGSKLNKSNADHSILFECINLIIHYATSEDGFDKKMLEKAAGLLGRFVALKEANIRYLGLDTMARLAKVACLSQFLYCNEDLKNKMLRLKGHWKR